MFQEPQYHREEAIEGRDTYTVILANLIEFVRYSLQVTASTRQGEGPSSSVVTVQTDPDSASPPRFVNASAINATAIELTWGFPNTPRGIIRGYTIYQNATTPDGTNEELNITLAIANDTSDQSYIFDNLRPFTHYGFRVAAYSFSNLDDPFVLHLGDFSNIVVERTDEAGMN